MILFLLAALFLQGTAAPPQGIRGVSPIPEPYAVIGNGSFSGPEVPESPDPLVAYRWLNPKASEGLEIFLLKPKTATADRPASFDNLASLTGSAPDVTVKGAGRIMLDFGVEIPAWVEFDSPDCPGGVRMSISEYNEPGQRKTRTPVRHGGTFRLELNRELYDGVRFAWIQVTSFDRPWHITGIRAVCQTKPVNYNGSFGCDDPLLTRIWYMGAYSVRASLCKDYFGAILMDRGDRMSWTGDAHPSQAAALVAFGNTDFIKRNLDATSAQNNGIRSYSLYWILSLIDYYMYTGDAATLTGYIGNACAKLDEAYDVFPKNPKLRFYGWDERLCAGFELWFKPAPEAQRAYQALSIRVWTDFAAVMGRLGRADLKDKYDGYAREKMADQRNDRSWFSDAGLHAAADAVTTGLLSRAEEDALFEKEFRDRVNGALAWDGSFHAVPGIGGAGQDAEFVYFTSVRPGAYEMSVSYGGTTPEYREPPVSYAARFIKQDPATGGSWGGVYGVEGYVLCNYNGGGVDKTSLPAYVKSLEYFRAFPKCCAPDPMTWATSTADRRAPAPDPANTTPRTAACVSNTDQTMTVAFAVAGPRDYQVALYFVDWEDKGARLAVEMFDADTLKLVAPVKIVDGFAGGRYVVYAYNKSAKFRIDKVRGDLVTLSGIFFDPAPAGDPAMQRRELTADRRRANLSEAPQTCLNYGRVARRP
jgi:hypothetical protein